jgi:predicted permease
MRPLRIFLARLRALVRRDIVADEIRDELQFHLEMRTQEYEQRGARPEEARRMASRRVGNLVLLHDRGYDIRGGGVMETVIQDVRYAVRLLRQQPRFSIVAILTLALGIGASTALFSVIDAALLRPLPYAHPEQLVDVKIDVPQRNGRRMTFGPSMLDARDWRESGQVFSQIAEWRRSSRILVDAGTPERVSALEISEGYLETYGLVPALGRTFGIDDTRDGAVPVVMISHAYWQDRFGGSHGVLGRAIRVGDESTTIVGIMPAGFYRTTAVYRPLKLLGLLAMRGTGAATYARLRPGLSLAQAERELTGLAARLAAERGQPSDVHVHLQSLLDRTTSGYRTTVNVLAGSVGFILLIACVNVAGLLLARGATRSAELAVRASIGAGRLRLIQQLLTESLVLSLAGGGVGLLMAKVSLDGLVAIIPMALPSNASATINLPVLAFAVGISIATSVIFGLVPALALSRVDLRGQLSRGGRWHGSGLSRRGGQVLIAAEVTLAVVLLAGAGLMVRSFARLVSVDLGFDPDAIVTVEVAPLDPKPAALTEYYPQLLSAIRQMPGVLAAGAINELPLGGSSTMTHAKTGGGSFVSVDIRQVLPGYFEAIGLPLKSGRFLAEADRTSGLLPVVISEDASRQLFPDGAAIGRHVEVTKQVVEIVGVVGDVRDWGPQRPAEANVYLLFGGGDVPPAPLTVVVRPRPGADGLADQLRQAALGVGPRVFLERIRTGSDWFGDTVVTPRRQTLLFGLLGGLGLLLALVGIFGVTAYAVTRRTQEIGVRMAFGARPSQVVWILVRDAARPVAIGIIIGLGTATIATKAVASFLFNTTPTDPATFAAVAVTLGITACLAAWLPARQAARVDPVASLRAE